MIAARLRQRLETAVEVDAKVRRLQRVPLEPRITGSCSAMTQAERERGEQGGGKLFHAAAEPRSRTRVSAPVTQADAPPVQRSSWNNGSRLRT